MTRSTDEITGRPFDSNQSLFFGDLLRANVEAADRLDERVGERDDAGIGIKRFL